VMLHGTKFQSCSLWHLLLSFFKAKAKAIKKSRKPSTLSVGLSGGRIPNLWRVEGAQTLANCKADNSVISSLRGSPKNGFLLYRIEAIETLGVMNAPCAERSPIIK